MNFFARYIPLSTSNRLNPASVFSMGFPSWGFVYLFVQVVIILILINTISCVDFWKEKKNIKELKQKGDAD